ncbi:MAG TPA: chemotaxis protein [Anaeromyxobacteraceae bacterium]|nr:chemotaxis protein [Anaeromyxobacteraceae bacterium]
MRATRYAIYGALAGLGLPAAGTLVSAWLRAGGASPRLLTAAHSADPLVWLMDTVPLVLGALGYVIGRQHDVVVRQHEEFLRLERARRDALEQAAAELARRAKGLHGSASSFTASTAETAAAVRETSATMTQLSRTATAAAVTAETVIGLARESERAAGQGLSTADASSATLLALADDVHRLSERIASLNGRMGDVFEIASAVSRFAERSQALAAQARAEASTEGARALPALLAEMDRQADEAREASARAQAILGEVHGTMRGAVEVALEGSAHAREGASVVRSAAETMRSLSRALSDSARAAREIAEVAQQQESGFDQVRKAMNEIYLATEEAADSTREVADEAKSLEELAARLKRAVRPEPWR